MSNTVLNVTRTTKNILSKFGSMLSTSLKTSGDMSE